MSRTPNAIKSLAILIVLALLVAELAERAAVEDVRRAMWG